MTADSDRDWKLKLRYGKTTTEFEHFTTIAEGVVVKLSDGFSCRPGKAIFGMKVWASSIDEAADMVRAISGQIGFALTGKIDIYQTKPSAPPATNPHGYDIQFTPFDN
jgi:hypothetical protein